MVYHTAKNVVRGNHVYKTLQKTFIREALAVSYEIDNPHDSYAVAVY